MIRKDKENHGDNCTVAKGATAFKLATVMLAVEIEPKISKNGWINGHPS